MKIQRFILPLLMVLIFTSLGLFLGTRALKPQERQIAISAKKYAYNPEVIRVNKGDAVTLKLDAKDVSHGFFLEGYGIELRDRPETPYFWIRVKPKKGEEFEEEEWEKVQEVTFTASKIGKFHYRCSVTCGYLHPFMQGELIVEPNYPYYGALGMAVGIAFASVIYLARRKDETV